MGRKKHIGNSWGGRGPEPVAEPRRNAPQTPATASATFPRTLQRKTSLGAVRGVESRSGAARNLARKVIDENSSAKAKGRKLQQSVRHTILTTFPDPEADDVRRCVMGSSGEDLQLSPAVQRVFPYSVEYKARAAIASVYKALAQAASQKGRTPVAVVKADRKRPLVVIDHFLALLAACT